MKPKLNVSKEFLGQVEKATQSYCKQLVRICIKDCDSKFKIQHKKLQKSREDLHNLNFDIVESVKKRVHDLNKDLYEECLSIKNKKFDDLLMRSITHKKLVVTIPENLHLSDIERKVLSKGLSFIPTSAKNNRNKTNVDLQRFYRRVKLHAYFNDPDKPIYENSDVTTEYSAFRGGRHIVLLRLASASALALASGLTLRHPLLYFFLGAPKYDPSNIEIIFHW